MWKGRSRELVPNVARAPNPKGRRRSRAARGRVLRAQSQSTLNGFKFTRVTLPDGLAFFLRIEFRY